MRLTLRGWVVLICVPVLYVAGEILGFAFFRALAGAALGAVLAALVAAMRRPRVGVHREVFPDRVECGKSAMAMLQVRNQGTRRHPGFTAKDVLAGEQYEVHVRDLAARATATYRYPLGTRRRGRFTVGPLALANSDPLGLVSSWLVTGDVAQLWVHPRRHPVRTIKMGWPRHHYDAPGSPDPLAGSTDLRQIREYVPGDEVRHLHWKAMARTGTLMVREYSDPAEPRFAVVLDDRTGSLSPAVFEQAVEVAASLVCAALAAGHRTRLVTVSGDLDVESNTGTAGVRPMLDAMCEIAQSETTRPVPIVGAGAASLIGGASAGNDRAVIAGLRGTGATVTVFEIGTDDHRASDVASGVRVIAAGSAADAIGYWNEMTHR